MIRIFSLFALAVAVNGSKLDTAKQDNANDATYPPDDSGLDYEMDNFYSNYAHENDDINSGDYGDTPPSKRPRYHSRHGHGHPHHGHQLLSENQEEEYNPTPESTNYEAPAPFVPPSETAYGPPPDPVCTETYKPNSAKYMAYVCSSLYATATKWATTNCQAYYQVTSTYDDNSLYQAHLCTYWSQRSVMRVVTSCFIEAHLRNEFIMKYGKEGPGKWYCKYKEFVSQVNECYSSSLKYYPLGKDLNSMEYSVAALNPPTSDMPPFQFTGVSVAMCAYYNKDQVYNRGH